MGKTVRSYQVENLSKVDTRKYMDGDIFISDKTVAILAGGKLQKFNQSKPNLKDYVKKEEVQQLIEEALQKGTETNEQE